MDDESLIESLCKMRFDVMPATNTPVGDESDSIDMVELVMELEEEFDVEIPDEEAETNLTTGQALDYIKSKTKGRFVVSYPPYRTDIRHMVDLFEDVAIGYGYANIEPRLVRSMTVGTPRPEETTSDRVRQILIGLGFSEVMSLPLSTEEDQFTKLRTATPAHYPVVSNPKLKAYNVVRTHLLGGLLEALRENRRRPMPQPLFEIDNVVALDGEAETGAAEFRKVALVETGRESGYATARSVMDSLLRELGWQVEYCALSEDEAPQFVPGRAAACSVKGEQVGILGEVHPEVLTNFGLTHPVALAELTLRRVF